MTESLVDGRRVRVSTIADHVSRVSPAVEVGHPSTGERVVGVLERLRRTAGTPGRFGIDHGPAFIANALDAWASRHGARPGFSRPGKPTDTAFAESVNGRFRDGCLDQHGFASLEEARRAIETWRVDDNTERPHRALNQQSPAAWTAAWEAPTEAPD